MNDDLEVLANARERIADRVMHARIRWGWTFGKRAKVMAIDLIIADAVIAEVGALLKDHTS